MLILGTRILRPVRHKVVLEAIGSERTYSEDHLDWRIGSRSRYERFNCLTGESSSKVMPESMREIVTGKPGGGLRPTSKLFWFCVQSHVTYLAHYSYFSSASLLVKQLDLYFVWKWPM